MVQRLEVPKDDVAALCRRHGIRRLALFGSATREDFRPDSDVDILIEFEPGHSAGFFRLHDIEEALSELLGGRRVDLLNPKYLNPRIKRQVLDSAEVVYDQAE